MTLERVQDTLCGDAVAVSGELSGPGGAGIAGVPIIIRTEGHNQTVTTAADGSFNLAYTPQICPAMQNVSASYAGDAFNLPSEAQLSFNVFSPTYLALVNAPADIVSGGTLSVTLRLTDWNNSPVEGAEVWLSDGEGDNASGETDGNGQVTLSLTLTSAKIYTLTAQYIGNTYYHTSNQIPMSIQVSEPTCSDGTQVGQCSSTKPDYCDAQSQLVPDCSVCGCPESQCIDNACISDQQLYALLEGSVVYVEVPGVDSGSGVVVGQPDGQTLILTNKHVINESDGISNVLIATTDNQTAYADDIRIAPYGMDLAVISVPGTYGTPVQINYSEAESQGQDVIAIGSPAGIQNTVTEGIISNFGSQETSTGYAYALIQTDTPINPGNSGGGLFLKSDGHLIGINTFILTSSGGSQGTNFAIDIKDLQGLPAYGTWPEFIPTPRCSDGTADNACSLATAGDYCSDDSTLIPRCGVCGCSEEYPYCDANDGACFSCPADNAGYVDNNGKAYCCQNGYGAWVGANGNGFCCPPGEQGTTSGQCQ
jgi:hypothetical protein